MSEFTNSQLVNFTKISPNRNTPRNAKIDTITIHHCAGDATIEALGELMQPVARQMSSNYGIGSDGRIGMYCPESDRAWTSSSAANDNRAITIEVSNNSTDPDWTVSDKAMDALIKLCADICRRNGIPRLIWKNDKSLIGQVDKQNMTIHSWFKATNCPGPYLLGRMGYIAEEVNKRLGVRSEGAGTAPPTGGTGAAAKSPEMFYVQVGAFGIEANAQKYLAEVKQKHKDAFIRQSNGMFFVQVGAFSVRANAERFLSEVRKSYPGSFIKS